MYVITVEMQLPGDIRPSITKHLRKTAVEAQEWVDVVNGMFGQWADKLEITVKEVGA